MPKHSWPLTIKIDHQGFVIGIGQEHEQARYWVVFYQNQLVAEGFVEQQNRNRAFRQAVVAAQAAIEALLVKLPHAEPLDTSSC